MLGAAGSFVKALAILQTIVYERTIGIASGVGLCWRRFRFLFAPAVMQGFAFGCISEHMRIRFSEFAVLDERATGPGIFHHNKKVNCTERAWNRQVLSLQFTAG